MTAPPPPPSGEMPAAATTTPVGSVTETGPLTTAAGGGQRYLLVIAAALTVFLAGIGGVAFALVERGRLGTLPHGQDVPPADASVTDGITLPSKEEQRLREMVEGYLNPPKGKTMDPTAGLGLCMELGLLYLEDNRLAEADAHFGRLERFSEPRSYKMLGQIGRGVVLAMQNQPRDSNKYFRDVFAVPGEEKRVGPKPPKGMSEQALLKLAENKLGAIQAVRQNPRWRYWIARARWYNHKNGLPEAEVPFWMIRNVPLDDREAKQPRPDKEKGRKDP